MGQTEEVVVSEEGTAAVRGIMWGLALSIPLWAAIIFIVYMLK